MDQVSVCGAFYLEDPEIYEFVRTLGRELALNNYIVICGGKGGVMEAICRGVGEKNGISVGILPSINEEEANPYALIKIPTNLGENRNYLIVQSGFAVICIAGKVGTRMEAEYALKLNKPLITVPHTGGVSAEFSKKKKENIYSADTVKEIIALLAEIKKKI